MKTVTLTKKDRRDYLRTELRQMERLPIAGMAHIVARAIDTAYYPDIYGGWNLPENEDDLRTALKIVFREIYPYMSDQAIYDLLGIIVRTEKYFEGQKA